MLKFTLRFIGILLFILIGLTIAANRCHAVNFKFVNDTDRVQTYMLYWVDHPWRDQWPFPANMAGGELEPGRLQLIVNDYKPGHWIVKWSNHKEPKHIQVLPITNLVTARAKQNTIKIE